MKTIHVSIGVILQQEQIYLTRRLSDAHQGDRWEFPGGKVVSGESPMQALARELEEECGIKVISSQPWRSVRFSYPEREVELHIYIVDRFSGRPEPKQAQQGHWFSLDELHLLHWPDANQTFIVDLVNELEQRIGRAR